MRFRFLILLLLLCTLVIAKPSQRYIVGVDNQYPPYEYVDEHGQICGSNVEIMKAVAKARHIRIEFVADDWSMILQRFDRGEIQILAGLMRTEERQKHYLFTIPHTYLHYSMFQRVDSPVLQSWQELAGKRVMVTKGDVMMEYMRREVPSALLLPTANYLEAMQKLSSGAADAVVMPKLQGLMYISSLHLDNIVPRVNLAYAMPYCFAVHPGNEALRNSLNTGIFHLINTQKLTDIQARWNGLNEPQETTLALNDRHLHLIVLIFVLLIALVIAFNIHLHQRINRQKRYLATQIAERNNYEREFNYRHQLFVTGPIIFLKWNDTGKDMFESISGNISALGYDANDILSGRIHFHSIIHPEDIQSLLADRKRHLQRMEFSYFQIYRILCPLPPDPSMNNSVPNLWHDRNVALAGLPTVQIRWLFDFTIIIPDEVSRHNLFYGYLLDITNQKLHENELLQQQQAALVAIHTKDAFLTRISAEINSPLNALIGLVRKLHVHPVNEEQHFALDTITQSALNLKQILQQIHDFLSILKGSMGSQAGWYPVQRLFDPVIRDYQSRCLSRHLLFEEHLPEERTLLFLDRDWFDKIMHIVLDNALKFTHKGKITLTAVLEPLSSLSGRLVVQVSDTGIGIPPDKLHLIMEPFTQVDETYTRRFGGIGLGLSLARNLLVQMNATINIESIPQKGTTVTLIFPLELRPTSAE